MSCGATSNLQLYQDQLTSKSNK